MKKILTLALLTMSLLMEGCAYTEGVKQRWAKTEAEFAAKRAKKAEDAEKARLANEEAEYRANNYMEVIPRVMSEDFRGVKARYLSVLTHEKAGRKFVCLPDPEASSLNKVNVAYFTMGPRGPYLEFMTGSIAVDDKFEFLETRKGEPFNHEALLNLKKACLSDSNVLRNRQVVENKRKAAADYATKNAPKIAKQIKNELLKITGKSNIKAYSKPISVLDAYVLIRGGEIKKGMYVKLECTGQCKLNQFQVFQPNSGGYLLTHKSSNGKGGWERAKANPMLLESKTDLFKGKNIEGKIKYIQYQGLGSYMSLAGMQQALKIKEVR